MSDKYPESFMTADRVRFLTVVEMSEWLAVSCLTIRRLVASGELPASRVGRVLRFDPAKVDAYLARQQDVKHPIARKTKARSAKTAPGSNSPGT